MSLGIPTPTGYDAVGNETHQQIVIKQQSHMTSRDELARNLRALMAASSMYRTSVAVEQRSAKLGTPIGKSTVDRATRGETPINLDAIDSLAQVFDVEAWQLIAPEGVTDDSEELVPVKTADETREARLRALVEEAGSAAELSRRTGVAAPQISQVLNARSGETGKVRAIGNRTARKLESGMQKPTGWMDQPMRGGIPVPVSVASSSTGSVPLRVALAFERLTADRQRLLLDLLKQFGQLV